MAKDTIQTVYGVGYRLKSPTKIKTPPRSPKPDKSQQIADAWLQFRDVAFQRLAILESYATALTAEGGETSDPRYRYSRATPQS